MKRVIQIIWTIFWLFLGYAILLPTLSFTYSSNIYWYAIFYFAGMLVIMNLDDEVYIMDYTIHFKGGESIMWLTSTVLSFIAILVIGIGGTWGLFHAKKYRSLIGNIEVKEFTANVAPVSPEQMITVDAGIAYRVGEKVLGEDPGLGSRCELGEFYMQNVNGNLYWIAPLLHSGFWKWFGNDGTPGYVVVSATDERDYRLVKEVDGKPIKILFQPKAFWSEDLERHIYTNGYSGVGHAKYTFEVDDTWNPYWTVTLYDTKVGFSGEDAIGMIVVNPESGKIEEYELENAPNWSDRIHPESFIRQQVHYWGDLVKGYINWAGIDKIHPAKESSVVMGSDGAMYYYLGLHSSGSDEGTVGFMMVNCRTKVANWIQQAGATEEAAKKSAEGAVQEKRYVGSEGITYNIHGHATYEFLLKDNAGLMKMIALVNVHDHNIVGVGTDRLSAIRNYQVKMNSRGNASVGNTSDLEIVTINSVITRINSEVNNGNTIYYFMVKGQAVQFYGTSSISTEICLSKPGDKVSLSFISAGTRGDVEVRTFDNKEINFTTDPAEQNSIARKDSIRINREEILRDDVMNQKWEQLSPEQKQKLLKK